MKKPTKQTKKITVRTGVKAGDGTNPGVAMNHSKTVVRKKITIRTGIKAGEGTNPGVAMNHSKTVVRS